MRGKNSVENVSGGVASEKLSKEILIKAKQLYTLHHKMITGFDRQD